MGVQQNILGTRQDTFMVTLMVEHPHKNGQYLDYGIWDTRTGGEIDSEEHLYHPGAMKEPYSLGGRVNPGNIIMSRNFRVGRDLQAQSIPGGIQTLIDAAGRSRVIITMFTMDRYKNVHTPAIVWRGTLKRVTLPEHNSESTSDPGMLEIECSIDAPPTATG